MDTSRQSDLAPGENTLGAVPARKPVSAPKRPHQVGGNGSGKLCSSDWQKVFLASEPYQILFDSAPVGIALSNERGDIFAFNRRLCAMAGLSRDELRLTRAEDFYAEPGDRRRLMAQVRRAGKVPQEEVWLKRRNGTLLLGLVSVERIRLGGETVLMTVVQDITRQRKAEEHLQGVVELLKLFAVRRSRNDYLQAVVRLLRKLCRCRCAGVRLVDDAGRMPYAAQAGFNAAFIQQESACSLANSTCACARVLAGKPRPGDMARSTLTGSIFCNDAAHLAPELADTPANCVRLACFQAGYQSLAQAPIRHRGRLIGTIHLADPSPNRFPKDTINFVEAVAPLLGEALRRFEVEASLLESEARFRSMFERHNAPMLLIDPYSGAIVGANPAAATFYGYPTEKLQRMNVSDINCLPPQAVAAHRLRAVREHRNYFIFPHRLANGEIRTVEVHSSPIRVQGREVLFSIIHDITERKLLEKTVLDIGEKERQSVGRDLHDSLGGKLTGAALMAKALSQSLGGKSRLDTALAEEVVKCINECITQVRSIARGLCPIEMSVSGLVTALHELARETRRRTGIECRVESKRVRVRDRFLASHLFRIAQEAVNNAVRHARPRELTIGLRKENGQLCLEVSDDGKGWRKKSKQSAGMGLRTMRYRADLLGGTLNVIRGAMGGTTVTCTVPIAS